MSTLSRVTTNWRGTPTPTNDQPAPDPTIVESGEPLADRP